MIPQKQIKDLSDLDLANIKNSLLQQLMSIQGKIFEIDTEKLKRQIPVPTRTENKVDIEKEKPVEDQVA